METYITDPATVCSGKDWAHSQTIGVLPDTFHPIFLFHPRKCKNCSFRLNEFGPTAYIPRPLMPATRAPDINMVIAKDQQKKNHIYMQFIQAVCSVGGMSTPKCMKQAVVVLIFGGAHFIFLKDGVERRHEKEDRIHFRIRMKVHGRRAWKTGRAWGTKNGSYYQVWIISYCTTLFPVSAPNQS